MNSDFRELGGRDPHSLLGVQRGVSSHEVARAFRRNAAQGGHPDMGGDDRTFRQLTRARDVLLDSRRLAAYNAIREAAGTVRGESAGPRPDETPPTSYRQGSPDAMRGRGGSGTRVETRPSSVPAVPAALNAWAVMTVMLVLLGPLVWPAAVVTGLLALRRMGKRAAAQP